MDYDVTILSLFRYGVYDKYQHLIPTADFNHKVHYRSLINNRQRVPYILFGFLLNHVPNFLYRFFISDRYDFVVAFYEGAPTRFVAESNLQRGRKIAWLHTSTTLSLKNKSAAALEQIHNQYRQFSSIIAVSNYVADSFKSLFPDLAQRVQVAYNPVDIKAVNAKAEVQVDISRPEGPLLVLVGRMTPVKGYDRFLKVVNRLVQKGYDFHVFILGGGDRTPLEQDCLNNRLGNVRFLGHQDNPYPFMKMADWIVLPSYIEGLSSVLLEGLALGKAILATDCGGPREILGGCEYGLLVDNSEEGLEQGLSRILEEPLLKNYYENKAEKGLAPFEISYAMDKITGILDV